jgi:hypothetical protein
MADDTDDKQPKPEAAVTFTSPPSYYVSEYRIVASPFHTHLMLGRPRFLVDPSTGATAEDSIVEWLFQVTLSPLTLKLLAVTLSEAVEKYEAGFGPIPELSTKEEEKSE